MGCEPWAVGCGLWAVGCGLESQVSGAMAKVRRMHGVISSGNALGAPASVCACRALRPLHAARREAAERAKLRARANHGSALPEEPKAAKSATLGRR